LSDNFALANVLNDISNFETGQISVENNSQTVAVANTPTLNTTHASVGQIVGNYIDRLSKLLDISLEK
jgi:hypothetical protein